MNAVEERTDATMNAHDTPTVGTAAADRGHALMTEMLGADLVERITARNAIAPKWQRLTTTVLFGDVWLGEVLPLRIRSIVTVGVLASMAPPRRLDDPLR